MVWPFRQQQAHDPYRSSVRVEEVPNSGLQSQTGVRNHQQPLVEEPDNDGNYPQTARAREYNPNPFPPPDPHPCGGTCFEAPGFREGPRFGSCGPLRGQPLFTGDTPFAGHDPFADFGIRGPESMMANMKANMDKMRADMRNSFAEARAHSAPEGGSRFSYSCTEWTSVDGGRGGPKIEHRVAAYGSSDLGHNLRETVRDGGTGEIRILREESRPVGYRHKDRQHTQQAITNK